MNNIFQKNLVALSKKNSELANRLQAHIPLEIPQLVQENNAYNILYKGKLIHNPQNPLAEANEVFSMAENTPVSIHLVFCLGLGYLFQVASLNSQGSVVLYEPDLNILWLSFTLVDFSNDLLKSNVFITDNFDELTDIIHVKSGMKNSPVLLSLSSQRSFNPEAFDDFVKKLRDIVGAFSLDLKYTTQKLYPSLKMLLQNLPNLMQELPLARFKDAYKGKTAVVVSAGPTLDRNIETLKKYRDRFVLIKVGTAVKTLYENGIKPDFLSIIELYDSSKEIEGLDLKDVKFITEPYSHRNLRNYNYGQVFSHISANTPTNQFWAEVIQEDIEEYWSKGTVSYTALNSARLLGCSKIILVGQDLAYIEGQCYSKDSVYKDLVCEYNEESKKWEIVAKDFEKFASMITASDEFEIREKGAKERLKNLNASLYYVKGINGDMIPTESVYATFVKPLQEYAEFFNDRKYINTSLVGAQIDGFENMSLEYALADSETVGEVVLKTDFQYDKAKVYSILKEKVKELKLVESYINEANKLIKNINNDIKRYKTVNQDVLKTLKKIMTNYLTITSDLADKSKMLDFIIIADKVSLDFEMKMLKEFTVESVLDFNQKMSKFYKYLGKRIQIVERLVDESINSAS